MSRPIRFWIFSDFHCGHVVGFTPPGWDKDTEPVTSERAAKAWQVRRSIYSWSHGLMDQLDPPDVILVNGDAIDGKGQLSGGTEELVADRGIEEGQGAMAAQVIEEIAKKAPKRPRIVMSYGTPYHTGRDEDFESPVAGKVGAEKIGEVDNVDLLGTVINYRHFVGRSVIPHGRFTAPAREQLWNLLFAQRGEYPAADVIIRSHVHYYGYSGTGTGVAITTPAMQGYGSKFGMKIATGTVDVGFLTMEIYGPKKYTWDAHLWRAPFSPARKLFTDEEIEAMLAENLGTDA